MFLTANTESREEAILCVVKDIYSYIKPMSSILSSSPELFLEVFAKDMNGENKIKHNVEEILKLQVAKHPPFLFRF